MTVVLSEAPPTIARVSWHPWRAIRRLTDVTVLWEQHDGTLGTWCERSRTMTLHPEQSQAERRCTATHEVIHAERGDVGPCTGAVELLVLKEQARRLITLRALADAMAFHGEDLHALAEELWCDAETLTARLEHLHPAERGYLQRRLALKEHSA